MNYIRGHLHFGTAQKNKQKNPLHLNMLFIKLVRKSWSDGRGRSVRQGVSKSIISRKTLRHEGREQISVSCYLVWSYGGLIGKHDGAWVAFVEDAASMKRLFAEALLPWSPSDELRSQRKVWLGEEETP